MNYELEKICKTAFMATSRYYLGICLETVRETTKRKTRIAGVPTRVRTEHIPKTNLERYNCFSLFGHNFAEVYVSRSGLIHAYSVLWLLKCNFITFLKKKMVRHANIQIYHVAYGLACEVRRMDGHNLPNKHTV
jgi:hypothetical protein